MQHRTDLQFRYEDPENDGITDATWRVSCQIEVQDDDPNNFTLGVLLYEVVSPVGLTVDIYNPRFPDFRKILETAALEEFWSRAEKACQKSQHFADNIL